MKLVIRNILVIVIGFLVTGSCSQKMDMEEKSTQQKKWQQEFEEILPLLGHRNWVLIVDKAFPLQSAEGMIYIDTQADLISTAKDVIRAIEKSPHLKPIIYQDAEIDFLQNDLVKDIDSFKKELDFILGGKQVNKLLHETVFKKMEKAALLFKILVLKTECTIPYSSLFIELDCGYWSTEKENKLRSIMEE